MPAKTIITRIIRWFTLQYRIMQRRTATALRWRNADRYWPEWAKYQAGESTTVALRVYSEMRCQAEEVVTDYLQWLANGAPWRFRIFWTDYPLAACPPRVLGTHICWLPGDNRDYFARRGVFPHTARH